MSIFDEAMVEFQEVMSQEANVPIIYIRGIHQIFLLSSWAGRTAFRTTEKNASKLIWSDRDYMIPVKDLAIDGIMTTPLKGDVIKQAFGGPEGEQLFELMSPNSLEPCWRYSDPQRTIYRVHCKRVKL